MIDDIINKEWDVIVIGAGLGGGTIGRRLAEGGATVLFVEKGPFGFRAEQQGVNNDIVDPLARLIRGYESKRLRARIDGRETEFFSLIGSGVGGSSAFYAATLERAERHDIDDSEDRPHPTGGWPVSYDEFASYYSAAEDLFQVCGEEDPLNVGPASSLVTPPKLNERDTGIRQLLERDGLHPYHVHLGLRFLDDCQMCLGRKCPKDCKMDGRSAGVEPALKTGNAAVLDFAEVRSLKGSGDRISRLEVERDGRIFELRAKQYVLAAGTLASPRLLLSSHSEAWPKGCANGNDQVGRNLMLHLVEFMAVWPKMKLADAGATKTVSLRDFYYADGQRYGALGDMGIDASYGEIVHFLKDRFDRSVLKDYPALRPLVRLPAIMASKLLGRAKVFVGQIEDLPYEDNRVLWDASNPDHIRIEYTAREELRTRRREYRRLISRRVKGLRVLFLNYEPDYNFPHACGTLRFGDNSASSVVDRSCLSHEVKNLYVADASFMPTSTGINPGLTIIANALRVGDGLLARLAE